MSHPKRGLFIIINNKRFHPKTQMGERTGTDSDAANLYSRFKDLGFDVNIYTDLKAEDMLKVMIDAAKQDHSRSDCFGVAVLSHGDEGIVYGTDTIIKLETLLGPFKGEKCPSLIGKPKLFFIQACRGTALDHGVLQHDAMAEENKIYRIPQEADCLYAYSTVSGYFSWRNSTKGSWFVQALCKALKQHAREKDLVWILTRVNREVAYEFQSNASKEFMNRKKQVPSIVSMLTKDVVFSSK
ncbi:hypothetical protein CAPTEDRAFT_139929 [Capitella teleta]|uniref:Caspase family p20 domain-containing protein n=1 Tax=Capitella teleta TaxID=283909 RepID=R7VGB4_CAPTE|nr:hypothetical protein CAPTEDRAFT_139929 [Capitella teleta]|eukprot:ELU15346.1 hypothetical protein CAPTEDRAFT_139929 [Capitella teleta]